MRRSQMMVVGVSDSGRRQQACDKGGGGMRAPRMSEAGDGHLRQGAPMEGKMVDKGREEV